MSQIIPASLNFPRKLAVLPVQNKPMFPGMTLPLHLHNTSDIELVEAAQSRDNFFGVIMRRHDVEGLPDAAGMFRYGTIAHIMKMVKLPDDTVHCLISVMKRIKVRKWISKQIPLEAAIDILDDVDTESDETKAYARVLMSEMKQVIGSNPAIPDELRVSLVNIDNPSTLADLSAALLNLDGPDLQLIIEQLDVRKRLEMVLDHVKREQELLRIQNKVQSQINEKVEKTQREYVLREQLKAIKQELGMPTDAKTSEHQRFSEIIATLPLEGEVKEKVEQELEKFSLMDANSSEFIVTRNYLDTIVSLPWLRPERAPVNLGRAKRILDHDHYGLNDVKERILEYLAVRALKKDNRGSILCLVGPPGVGKTSIGKSIASALKKEFFRFSVGGMRDEAEIKGHRRTYVGAMPGKIIQGLKIAKQIDPVFMIDEIDKMGSSYQGDPSSALLEVLDPEQNSAFRDHYLDIPFDLSQILFVATANTLDTIPRPLLDRMEVIRLSGYIEEEKLAIANKYLLPKSRDAAGISPGDVSIKKGALIAIARGFSREAGLRNFEKALDKIHRKVARQLVLGEVAPPLVIDDGQVEAYLGKPQFAEEELKRISQPGMALGLAWTSFGGDTLIIEAVTIPGKEGFKLTGQMGEVMQESAAIAYSYARRHAAQFEVPAEFWEKNLIHLHIPAGATPKDGPSAGITMASALLSLATGKKIRPGLAMTGELSLVGSVLPIGGLKEKTIAARRNKVRDIVIPKQNEKDLEEIPENVRKGIRFLPVERMEQVIEQLFTKR